MVEYKCFRCNFTSNHKGNFINHLNRKNICTPTNDVISIENIKKFYGLKIDSNMTPIDSKMTHFDSKINFGSDSKMTPIDSKKSQIDSKMTHFDSKMTHFDSKIPESTTYVKYICAFCNKCYSKNSNMRRHEKNCKNKNEIIEDKTRIKELKEHVEQLLIDKNEYNGNIITNNNKHIDNSIHTDNSTTINVISLNNYGSENTQYITKEYLMGLLETPFQSIPELIKYTHFNKDYPENQNIKLPNKKEPYVKVLKDNKWELVDRKDTINDLIDHKHSILNTVDKNDINENIINRINKFNTKYLDDDKDLINKLYKDSELVLLNNS